MATTSATEKQADAIKHRMQQIRTSLPYEVDDARTQVKQLADWKYHYRKRPALMMAAAFAMGYLVVPHRKSPRQVVVYRDQGDSRDGNGHAAEKGLLGGILGAATTMAVRQGTSLAASKLGELVSSHAKTNGSHRA